MITSTVLNIVQLSLFIIAFGEFYLGLATVTWTSDSLPE